MWSYLNSLVSGEISRDVSYVSLLSCTSYTNEPEESCPLSISISKLPADGTWCSVKALYIPAQRLNQVSISFA